MIYLIRHGQAAASWGEHPDPGLSDLGREQAASVATALQTRNIAHAFTSPMARCRETGSYFANLSGFPDLILPAGFTSGRLPVGISLMGPAFSEGRLLALGYAFEQATLARRLPVHTPPLDGSQVEP